MPTYTFRCPSCNKIQEVNCKISEYDTLNKLNTVCECGDTLVRVFTRDSVPGTSSGSGRLKSPDWFKERISKINDNLGTKARPYK